MFKVRKTREDIYLGKLAFARWRDKGLQRTHGVRYAQHMAQNMLRRRRQAEVSRPNTAGIESPCILMTTWRLPRAFTQVTA